MITRTLTIQANPPYQIVLYFDSRSNAAKSPGSNGNALVLTDDYNQSVILHKDVIILSDQLADGAEMLRAQGEMEFVKWRAEDTFEKRIDADAFLKAFRVKKRTEQAMKSAQKIAMPQGIQQ